MNNPTNDLAEEVQARQETRAWESGLRDCPVCHGRPHVHQTDHVEIWCNRWGCRKVSASTREDALILWNATDFRDSISP